MVRVIKISLIIALLITIGVNMVYSKQDRKPLEPKKIIPKFIFGKEGKGLGEFTGSFETNLLVKDNYLFVAEGSGADKIQILNINSDGSLSPKSTFGKEGKGLGEFVTFSEPLFLLPGYINLAIKYNYLYIADAGNQRIQVFKINTDGSLLPKFSYGKPGNKLGEFGIPYGIAIKDNYLFVSDTGYHCIQVLKIKY